MFRDRRVILAAGAGLALVCGLGLAFVFLNRGRAPAGPPPAAQGGLVVISGRQDDRKLDPQRPLRCFVGGQFVGELPLAACAERNGVATGALDVGLDPAGALAASNGASAGIVPLPPQEPPLSRPLSEAGADANSAVNDAEASSGPATEAACWRYGSGGGWKALAGPLGLSACVEAVYGARCPPPGQAFYGRWGDQTLRLEDGRVEISPDNANFQGLIDVWPPCQSRAAPPARPATAGAVGSRP